MNARQIDLAEAPWPGSNDRVVPRGVTREITDNLWVVVGFAVASATLAGVYAFFSPPIFLANALVQITIPKQNELIELVSRQRDQVSSLSSLPTNTEMAIVRSRNVLAPVIAEQRLDIVVTPRRFPVIDAIANSFAIRGKLSRAWFGASYAWGGELAEIVKLEVPNSLQNRRLELKALGKGGYRLFDEEGNLLVEGRVGELARAGGVGILVSRLVARAGVHFTVVRLKEVTAIAQFLRQLNVSEVGTKTGLVRVSFGDSDPRLATVIANSIVQSYVQSQRIRQQEETNKMLSVVDSELPRLRDSMKRAEATLQEHRASSRSIQATSESQSFLQGSTGFDQQIAALNCGRNCSAALPQKARRSARWMHSSTTSVRQRRS